MKLTSPAVSAFDRFHLMRAKDEARLLYLDDLNSKDKNTEIELAKRSGFTLKVTGDSVSKPADWSAYRSLVMESSE